MSNFFSKKAMWHFTEMQYRKSKLKIKIKEIFSEINRKLNRLGTDFSHFFWKKFGSGLI